MKSFGKLFSGLAVAGLLFLGAGCQTGPRHAAGYDFSRLRSFAVLPVSAPGTYEDPALVARLSVPAREAVVETLTAKGLRQTGAAEADCHVKMLFDYLPESGRTETRMFALQILDAKSQQVVWSDYWHRTTDTSLPTDAVRAGIAKMLQPFPPGKH
jgi:hypothetical protein